MDGQQTSNPRLTQDLSAFPQAIYFSGHSHLNLNDPRSIHQKSFTAVNDSSSSYIEIDHGYQMLTAEGQLANRFETPTAQAVAVEVYPGRTVINRINFNADLHDIYTDGKWSANWQPPYLSDGTLAGEAWEVSTRGGDSKKIVETFTYTDANRNTSGPTWPQGQPVEAVAGEDGNLTLRIHQAADDEMVHHYRIRVTRDGSNDPVLDTKLANRFDVVPAPSVLDVPLPVKRMVRVSERKSSRSTPRAILPPRRPSGPSRRPAWPHRILSREGLNTALHRLRPSRSSRYEKPSHHTPVGKRIEAFVDLRQRLGVGVQ